MAREECGSPASGYITRRRALALAGSMTASLIVPPAGSDQKALPMQSRAIPSSGEKLPVVGCGTWQTFDVGPDRRARPRLAEVLQALFDSGGSVIDSSPMYGTSEQVVGDLLSETGTRSKAFLATKVWTRGRLAGLEQMQRSMELLRVGQLDLMQVHNLVDWRTHLKTSRALKAEGRIRYIGVTHCTSSAYPELVSVMRSEPLDFVQVNYSADDRAAEERVLPLASDRGMAVLINMPFGGGGLLRRLRGRPVPSWASDVGSESWAQLLLKFVLGNAAVTCVIPGTANPDHMRENAKAGSGMSLDQAEKLRIVAELEG